MSSESARFEVSESACLEGSESTRLEGSESTRLEGSESACLEGSESTRLEGSESARLEVSESARFEVVVPNNVAGTRLDRFLVAWLEPQNLSRSRLKSLIEEERVSVDARFQKASTRLKGGENVVVEVPPPRAIDLVPTDIPLDILFEDECLVVLNKPAGLVVHPARGSEEGTLVHGLLFHVDDLSGINGEERPGIVHRLDKDTSGVLVVAKNDPAHRGLAALFKTHSIRRQYRALVRGQPAPESGTWRSEIGRNPANRLKMKSLPRGGRRAVTHYRVLESLPGASLLEMTLETGRTHQIRVHASEAGHPVLSDPVYGAHSRRGLPEDELLRDALDAAPRQLLHARLLGFEHPLDGQYVEFTAEPPRDFQAVLERLREIKKAEQGEGKR